ncbi:MAG: flagellar alpha dynein [Microcoleus sp. PH2017_40_RAT_O_B]|uniref:flagellar alpha dynein n=1 Tax=unclassified Microcoleus TaxID=2642155 RepID=UPI001DBA96D3|nr:MULTISPECIES: flagellar alpha dynein [unclassified Microcoleus]MCC3573736.1 flagellar alpha dynein [Microcoleus sp. PH2017_34_RAT_O_A]MCC3611182.1 flagellar alpha dynein [Microcoleus sp. PH2017_40_RAT_O_B]
MRHSLENSDRLVVKKNQEISELKSRLAAVNREILERNAEIENLESELASRSPAQSKNSATVGTDLSKVEAANLLNQLKAQRKKSKADLADIDTVLEILNSERSEK